jgi:hypothetical protein
MAVHAFGVLIFASVGDELAVYPVVALLAIVLVVSGALTVSIGLRRVLEVVVVLEDAPVLLAELDSAYVHSRFGESSGGRKGLRRMLDCIARGIILDGRVRYAGRSSTAWTLYRARMAELGLRRITRRKRLASRDAQPGLHDQVCIVGLIVTLPPFTKLPTELSAALELIRATKPAGAIYVYVAPDPAQSLSSGEALAKLEHLWSTAASGRVR